MHHTAGRMNRQARPAAGFTLLELVVVVAVVAVPASLALPGIRAPLNCKAGG
jgi:prepilin-type N-terminal cleavage/methylation domain-containing protein